MSIHSSLLDILKSDPEGMTIHEIRERFPLMERRENENLSRRLRELRKNHYIPFQDGKYIYFGPRQDATKDDGYIGEKLRMQVLHHYGHRCQSCGQSPADDGIKLQIDHRRPHSLGGATEIENLWPLCEPCNRAKKNHFVSYLTVNTKDITPFLNDEKVTNIFGNKVNGEWNFNLTFVSNNC